MAKILLIDDSTMARVILRRCFQQNGHEVIGETGSAREGLKLYKELRPDVVILDMVMPDGDGLAVLDNITRFDKEAKVIIYTSTALQNTVIKAMQLGAKNFLVKPASRTVILKAIDKALGREVSKEPNCEVNL